MKHPSFLSRQVIRSNYYFLDLAARAPSPRTIVLCGGLERCAPAYRVDRPNGFFCHGLEFVAGGKGAYCFDGKWFALHTGAVIYYPPHTPHHIHSDADTPLVKYFVDFVGDPAVAWLQNSPLKSGKPLYLSTTDQIGRCFDDLQHNGERTSTYSPIICAHLLEILILQLCERKVARSTKYSSAHDSYARCRTFMEQHFRTVSGLAEIARVCHVDVAYLCRLFHEFAGQSPHQLLMQLKIRRAAELLATGKMMVKEVAYDVGFKDPGHFSKMFKRTHGVSPTHFLKRPHA